MRPVPCARRLNVAASSSDVPASSRGGARRRWGPTPASWHLPGLQGTRRETGWPASLQPGAGAAVRRELRAADDPFVCAASGGEERSGSETLSRLGGWMDGWKVASRKHGRGCAGCHTPCL